MRDRGNWKKNSDDVHDDDMYQVLKVRESVCVGVCVFVCVDRGLICMERKRLDTKMKHE